MSDGGGSTVRLRVDLAYDGSGFHGFARQPGLTTVQGVLEDALQRVFGQPVVTTCAGRTDAGVHARGQVVHGDLVLGGELPAAARRRTTALLADLDQARHNLDHAVGDAVTIWSVRVVGDEFDARFGATARHYRYRLVDAVALDPLDRVDAWHVRGGPLRLRAMQQAARCLLGEHDFASLCRKAPGRTTIRRITQVAVSRPRAGEVHLRLVGTAFCHQQVRSITGCLVEVGRGRREPGWMAEVLAARDRSVAAAVAPPQGLVLERVAYGRRWPASPIGGPGDARGTATA